MRKVGIYLRVALAVAASVVMLPFGLMFTMNRPQGKTKSKVEKDLLRKIRTSGYSSLTVDEREALFNASK